MHFFFKSNAWWEADRSFQSRQARINRLDISVFTDCTRQSARLITVLGECLSIINCNLVINISNNELFLVLLLWFFFKDSYVDWKEHMDWNQIITSSSGTTKHKMAHLHNNKPCTRLFLVPCSDFETHHLWSMSCGSNRGRKPGHDTPQSDKDRCLSEF